jgi:hypothetical protein
MTVKQTIASCRALGMTCRYSDGEYRVNYPGGAESTAYYTSDSSDAIGTARQMAKSRTYRKANGQFGIFGA